MAVQVRGVAECMGKLRALNRSVQRRILRKGVRAACMVGARRGRPQVPKGKTGLLKKSLGYKIAKARPGKFTALGIVGPRARLFRRWIKGRGMVDPSKYGHLVEGGTKPHKIVGKGWSAAPLAFGPKPIRRLAFKTAGGRSVVVARVSHPGSRPQRFMQLIQVSGQYGMGTAFRAKVNAELMREAAKSKPSEVDDGE